MSNTEPLAGSVSFTPPALANVTLPIMHLIPFEVRNMSHVVVRVSFLASGWRRAFVAVRNIEVVVHMAVKTFRAMKPRACADKDSSRKPFRTVVSIRRAGIWRVIVVSVWTIGCNTNIH